MMRVPLGCAALAAVLLVTPFATRADEEVASELDDRWIPAFNSSFLLFAYEGEGELDSSIGFSGAGDDDKTVPVFQIGLDLKSPSVAKLPGKPRFAFFAGFQGGASQEITFTEKGLDLERARFGEFVVVDEPGLVDNEPESSLARNPNRLAGPASYGAGQGSELKATYESTGWYAGAGVSFELPTSPRFRLRPFVMYTGEQVTLQGKVVRVVGDPPVVDSGGNIIVPSTYEILRTRSQEQEIFHYLGPGLELEADLVTGEYLGVSLYATVDLLWLVSDDEIEFRDSFARYSFEADGFKPRGGLGLRIFWSEGLSF